MKKVRNPSRPSLPMRNAGGCEKICLLSSSFLPPRLAPPVGCDSSESVTPPIAHLSAIAKLGRNQQVGCIGTRQFHRGLNGSPKQRRNAYQVPKPNGIRRKNQVVPVRALGALSRSWLSTSLSLQQRCATRTSYRRQPLGCSRYF